MAKNKLEDVQTIADPRTGEPAYAVVPIASWHALLAAAEDRADVVKAGAARAALADGGETFPHSVAEALVGGASPVRTFREHRGLTQRALADKARVRQATISEIEAGQLGTVATLSRIANALGVAIDDLLPTAGD